VCHRCSLRTVRLRRALYIMRLDFRLASLMSRVSIGTSSTLSCLSLAARHAASAVVNYPLRYFVNRRHRRRRRGRVYACCFAARAASSVYFDDTRSLVSSQLAIQAESSYDRICLAFSYLQCCSAGPLLHTIPSTVLLMFCIIHLPDMIPTPKDLGRRIP
jgi:hypothetical protein